MSQDAPIGTQRAAELATHREGEKVSASGEAGRLTTGRGYDFYRACLNILETEPKLRYSSNLRDTREHWAYQELLREGAAIVPYLKDDILQGDVGWTKMMLLRDVVPASQQPHFPADVAGRHKAILQIWREWALTTPARPGPAPRGEE